MTAIELNPEFLSNLCLSNAKRGSDAFYFHIPGTKWGIKLFCSSVQRDINYNRQAEIGRYNLAPSLGDMVDDIVIDGQVYYGFITEHVRIFMIEVLAHYGFYHEYVSQCKTEKEADLMSDVLALDCELPDEWKGKYDELCNQLETLPEDIKQALHYDLHDFNWGLNDDDVPIMIDFSRMGRDDDYST